MILRKRKGRDARYSGPDGSTIEELAAQLAPPEEQQQQQGAHAGNGVHHAAGSIVVDTGALKLPSGFAESRRESRFEISRVVAVTTVLMLLFTAFVAWQITRMPAEDEPQPVRVVNEQ